MLQGASYDVKKYVFVRRRCRLSFIRKDCPVVEVIRVYILNSSLKFKAFICEVDVVSNELVINGVDE